MKKLRDRLENFVQNLFAETKSNEEKLYNFTIALVIAVILIFAVAWVAMLI